MTKIILKDKLDELLAHLINVGFEIFAPTSQDNYSHYAKISQAKEMDFNLILPKGTLKELFFPRSECLIKYKIHKKNIELSENRPQILKRIVFGAKPCDANAIAINDKLFYWDYNDQFWFDRRKNTIIISIACTNSDEFCMCTSLGNSPDDTKGSDIILHTLKDETGWTIEEITEKGKELLTHISQFVCETETQPELAKLANIDKKFNLEHISSWLSNPNNFDSKLWNKISQRCIGCSVCTYLCPTCHCFDIQDEGDAYSGTRRRNWDSCSFPIFTLHTSGHNPRPTQAERWRQRIMHKFNYYPNKFNVISCTGCGRCTRLCPVDMGITETLSAISNTDI